MQQLSRRQKNNKQKIQKQPYLDIEQAIKILKETATAKFNETVECHVNLNIDPKYADQQLRTAMTLPNGNGKITKIAVLTNENNSICPNHSESRPKRYAI